MPWNFFNIEERASTYHNDIDFKSGRAVCCINPTSPALVLGSSQSKALVDRVALKSNAIDLVVRRSGGGIVHLHPEHFLWLDVKIPIDDPQYKKDINESALWLGKIWQQVLSDFGIVAEVYQGNFKKGSHNGLVCFSSRAPGEILIGEAKAVGIAQRRSKLGTWLQSILLLRWEPELFVPYLVLENLALEDLVLEAMGDEANHKQKLVAELKTTALGVELNPNAVRKSFLKHISKY